jgi:hypothetical protein
MNITTGKTSVHEVGSDTPLLGWESPTYGDLQPAVSLVYATQSRLPVRLVTVVLTHERCRLETQGDEIVILRDAFHGGSAEESEIYRVSLSGKNLRTVKRRRSTMSVPTA